MILLPRKTVKTAVTMTGRGLHSGTPVELTIHPGEQGIAFRHNGARVEARPENVTDTTRCTRLGEISTIEHLMSALAGLEVTDAEIELTAPELPGLDGSAKEYVDALLAAGFEELGEREFRTPFSRIFQQEDGGLKGAIAKGDGHWRYVFDTDARWPGRQVCELTDVVGGYVSQIAPARTFAFEEELPMIEKYGLGKGLDETSALVLGQSGYLNAARFPDEPVRHKLLDLIGDLYLAGIPLRALSVVAERTGHRSNIRLASLLAQSVTSPAETAHSGTVGGE